MPTLQNPADSEIKTPSALMPEQRRINYACHKINIITQMPSQLDTYPDNSWLMICGYQPRFHTSTTKTPCKE